MDPAVGAGVAVVPIGALAYLVRYLIKRVVDRWFEQGIGQFRIQTAAVHEAETERLRAQLAIAATEHQVRFERLHERRVQVLAETYARMVAAHRALQSWTARLQLASEPPMEEKARKLTAGRQAPPTKSR